MKTAYNEIGLSKFSILSGAALAALAVFLWAAPASAQAVAAAPKAGPPLPDLTALGKSPGPASSSPADGKILERDRGNLSDAEDKASDSVRDVVKHLGTTESVTIEDLNAARQTVAKIEALIDVEKHLIELDKLRSERDGGRALASAIPASALKPMQAMPMPAAGPMMTMPADIEIARITGGAGHYSAMIKAGEGFKLVQAGDRLETGGKVLAIDPTTVQIEQNGVKRAVHVKNVNTVFGGSP